MRTILAVLALFASCAFARDIRVAVYDIGNSEHRDEVVAACWNEFAAIPGVKMLDDERSGVDYLILLSSRESPGAVAISVRVIDRIDPMLKDRFYIKSDYRGQMESAGYVAEFLAPALGQAELEVGPPDSIKTMCHTLAALVDRVTFLKERTNPHGGSFDDAFQNFLVRMGFKRTVSK